MGVNLFWVLLHPLVESLIFCFSTCTMASVKLSVLLRMSWVSNLMGSVTSVKPQYIFAAKGSRSTVAVSSSGWFFFCYWLDVEGEHQWSSRFSSHSALVRSSCCWTLGHLLSTWVGGAASCNNFFIVVRVEHVIHTLYSILLFFIVIIIFIFIIFSSFGLNFF